MSIVFEEANNPMAMVLAFGRMFACLSAASNRNPTKSQMSQLRNVLNQPMYTPRVIDLKQDCKPYIFATRGSAPPVKVVFMPSWARAGVRYTEPGIDLRELDPGDWYHIWWELYRETCPNHTQEQIDEQYGVMFASLGENIDEIRSLIEANALVLKADAIRNLQGPSVNGRF